VGLGPAAAENVLLPPDQVDSGPQQPARDSSPPIGRNCVHPPESPNLILGSCAKQLSTHRSWAFHDFPPPQCARGGCLPRPGLRRYPDLGHQTQIGSASSRWGEQQRVGFPRLLLNFTALRWCSDEGHQRTGCHHRKAASTPCSPSGEDFAFVIVGHRPTTRGLPRPVLELGFGNGAGGRIPAADYGLHQRLNHDCPPSQQQDQPSSQGPKRLGVPRTTRCAVGLECLTPSGNGPLRLLASASGC